MPSFVLLAVDVGMKKPLDLPVVLTVGDHWDQLVCKEITAR